MTKALLLALCVVAGSASAQTFDMTPDQFKAALNTEIMKDANDPETGKGTLITKCSKGAVIQCHFGDAAFKVSVEAMKKMNLANGKFVQNSALIINTKAGKVSSVSLMGSNSDPSNMFTFYGHATEIIQIWDPEAIAKDEDLKRISGDLDLMGQIPSRSESKIEILDHVAIRCNHDEDSGLLACVYEPRS